MSSSICQDRNGEDYSGSVSKTTSGLTCQKWTSQSPHTHSYAKTGDHNFCRNPSGSSHLWCYTTSKKKWEYCEVPLCGKEKIIFLNHDTLTFKNIIFQIKVWKIKRGQRHIQAASKTPNVRVVKA